MYLANDLYLLSALGSETRWLPRIRARALVHPLLIDAEFLKDAGDFALSLLSQRNEQVLRSDKVVLQTVHLALGTFQDSR